MRMLIADPYYERFLSSHYQGGDLAGISYEILWRELMGRCFGTADFYSRALEPLGVHAHEVVSNAYPLQLAWAKEHAPRLAHAVLLAKVPRMRQEWQRAIFRKQILWFRPDVILYQHADWAGSRLPEWARDQGVRLQILQHATIPPPVSLLRSYDLVISSVPELVGRFDRIGIPARFLKLGFGSRVSDVVPNTPALFDVVHVGGYGGLHHERDVFLEQINQQLDCLFWGYGVEELPHGSAIVHNYQGEAWGIDMYRIRASSRFTVTKHITKVAGPWANNSTMYEATGVGSCLVVDAKENLSTLFAPDEEVVTFSSPDEAAEKIRYLLANERERKEVAKRGQRRTLTSHTYEHRMTELVGILKEFL